MNTSNYDSAQYVLTDLITRSDNAITLGEMYLIRCFEAEILYYNALFEQGLNTTLWSLDLAKELDDERFLGNSHNLIGLFLMNLNRHNEAIHHFKKAADLISPNEKNDFLSQRYHALGNLGETYLKINKPDSAIFYSELSLVEAQLKNKERGIALARYNIAEAEVLRNNLHEATSKATQGFNFIKNSVHRDVVQFFCTTLMKIYSLKNDKDSINYWLNIGLAENENALNTDLSRLTFLQSSFAVALETNQLELAQNVLSQINTLQQKLNNKQQSQRISILQDYYEKTNKLALAAQESEIQSNKLKIRSGIITGLVLFALLLIILFLIFRKNSIQKQHIARLKEKEALFRERNRIASDLHDDIGAALSSIRIYSSAANTHIESNPLESKKLIKRINDSSAEMMEKMSDIVWSIHPQDDSFESIILRMKSFATEILSSAEIDVNYTVDKNIYSLRTPALLKRNFYLIFKEAVNNIVKYSKAKKTTIEIQQLGATLQLSISDDGCGFDANQVNKGNGLNNMELRAQALGGKLHCVSQPDKGTSIQLSIPITNISDVT